MSSVSRVVRSAYITHGRDREGRLRVYTEAPGVRVRPGSPRITSGHVGRHVDADADADADADSDADADAVAASSRVRWQPE